jgi:hypothetical protein
MSTVPPAGDPRNHPQFAQILDEEAAALADEQFRNALRVPYAKEIVQAGGVEPSALTADGWRVQAPSEALIHEVVDDVCTCLDFAQRGAEPEYNCVHILAVQLYERVLERLFAP